MSQAVSIRIHWGQCSRELDRSIKYWQSEIRHRGDQVIDFYNWLKSKYAIENDFQANQLVFHEHHKATLFFLRFSS